MDAHCLNDQKIYPDDDVLAQVLGKTKASWDALGTLLKTDYPLASAEWRYYRDGKSWLCKVTQKKKTLCWLSVHKGFFRTTFYFGDKVESAIVQSQLSETIKDEWLHRERIGKIRPISLSIRKRADLKTVQALLEIKASTN
jgi:hypothetical protein